MAVFRAAAAGVAAAGGDAGPPAAPVVTGSVDAANKATVASRPELPYLVLGLAMAVGGFVAGHLLQKHYHPEFTNLPVLNSGVGIFSLFYIMAQTIERVLVPISWFGGSFAKSKKTIAQERQAKLVAAAQPDATADALTDAAAAQHAADQYSANLTATTFGLAALLAMVLSGYTGLFLLSTVGVHVRAWVDVIVTGLAIAGGTKPLHDLISNISKSSAAK